MNERIEDLLYQAGLTAQGCWDKLGTYEQEAIEKFAELIVRECIIISQVGSITETRLKQHFGVEE